MRGPIGVAAAAVLSVAGCTTASEPTTPPTTWATGSPTTQPAPPPTPAATTPLVLAVHPNRAVADVPVDTARVLLTEGGTDWSALGQPPGPLRVVAGGVPAGTGGDPAERAPTAAAALDVVRTDPAGLALVPADAVDPTVRVLTVDGIHPLRTPDRYPLDTPSDAPPGAVVTMTVVGDIMLGRRVGAAMAAAGDLAAPLRPLAERLASADVTIGNFEATLSQDGSPTQGDDSFAADPGVAAGLQLAGFDVLSLANNHVGDWGDAALVQTVDAVRAMGIMPVGAGTDLDHARAPVILGYDGVRIGIIATDSIGESPAAGAGRPGTNRLDMPPRTGPLDRAALARITADIAGLDGLVDTVVVVPHWGTQYTNVPEPSQRQAAAAFVEAGADLVIGGHPHWVQGWEMIGDALVVHSLGNFVFDMDFMRETQEGLFVEIVLWGGRVMAVEPVPYVIGEDFAPRVAPPERAAPILELARETSGAPFGPG
jgi:poly-gamma-glutamate synthesis protein (capsule biosynthesis protein)